MMRGKKLALFIAAGTLALFLGFLLRAELTQKKPRHTNLIRFPQEFAALTSQDPLFWDPSLDPDKLGTAVKKLRAIENEFGKLAAKSKTDIENGILFLPLSFLEELPRVGIATRAFLNQPSAKYADQLLIQYDATLEAYEKEVTRLATTFEKYSPNLPKEIASKNELASNIPLLKKNGTTLREEIARRKSCAATGECTVKFPPPITVTPPPVFYPSRIPDKLLFPTPEYYAKQGLVRVPSECWPTDSPWHEIYLVERRIPSEPAYLITKLADENLYLRILDEDSMNYLVEAGRVTAETAEWNREFLTRGMQLVYLADGRFTRCTDLTHYPKGLTLLWLQKELRSASIFQNISFEAFPRTTQDTLRAAQKSERELMQAEAPSWDQAVKFAGQLQSLLGLARQEKTSLPHDALDAIIKIRSAITSGLPKFDEVLNALADNLGGPVTPFDEWKKYGLPGTADRMSQSHFLALTYLAFSRSTWRVADALNYTKKTPPSITTKYTREKLYTLDSPGTVLLSQIRDLFSDPELTEVGRKTHEIYSDWREKGRL